MGMWILIIIVLVIVGVVFLAISQSNSKLTNTKPVNNIPNPSNQTPAYRHTLPDNVITRTNTTNTTMRSAPTYNFNIVGEGSYQSNLKKIAGPKEEQSKFHQCSAKVTSEPTNKFDKNAIKVEINGMLVGYLSKGDAQKLVGRRVNKVVSAVIDGGWDDSDGEGSYGVKLGINNVSDLI